MLKKNTMKYKLQYVRTLGTNVFTSNFACPVEEPTYAKHGDGVPDT